MNPIGEIRKSWRSLAVIGGIVGTAILAWNYTMAQARDVARTEVQATVNREMIEGAKRAAADAVKEQLPEIAKQAAQEAVKALIEAQKAEAARNGQPHR